MLVAGITALQGTATAASGPHAVVAKKKKKCKKKKNRAGAAGKKCKRNGAQDPIARATTFLGGQSYTYLSYSNTTGASTSYRIDLCRNGAFNFRGEYVGYSGFAWADSYGGTWKVTSATPTSAQLAYTTSNYQVSDPYYASPPPPSGTLNLQALSETTLSIDGAQYSRGAGVC